MWILSHKYLLMVVILSNTDRRKNSILSPLEVLIPPDKVCKNSQVVSFIPYNNIPHTRQITAPNTNCASRN